MTLTEKIIAKACDRPSVTPNDNVWVKTDVLMTHDVCGPGTIGNFYKEFGPKAKVYPNAKGLNLESRDNYLAAGVIGWRHMAAMLKCSRHGRARQFSIL